MRKYANKAFNMKYSTKLSREEFALIHQFISARKISLSDFISSALHNHPDTTKKEAMKMALVELQMQESVSLTATNSLQKGEN